MKQILLLLMAFTLSLSLKAQVEECPIGFDINAGVAGCEKEYDCNGSTNYLVDGRLQLFFEPGYEVPETIVIQSVSIAGNTYTCFVEYSRTTLNNRTRVEFCVYGAIDAKWNLGAQDRILTIVFGSGLTCLVEKITGQAALPVSIKSFTATRSKQTVGVKFETLSESNNKGFYVQRNTNGTWENIAFIFSKAPNGNSGTPISYEYNDTNPIKGVSQYRLQQVDLDLRVKYSEIRMVRGEEQPAKHLLFPNPSSDGKVNIVFDTKSATRNILVSDMSGRIVKSFRNVTAANLSIDNLENGVYSIQIIDLSTSESVVEKVIIKKR